MDILEIKLNTEEITENIDSLLPQLFQPGTSNYQKLSYELQREFKWGGSPDVTRIAFDRIKYDDASGKGSFRITLDISFTFGCEDVQTDKVGQTSEWTFEIDKTALVIKFYSSPYAESRSTADEF